MKKGLNMCTCGVNKHDISVRAGNYLAQQIVVDGCPGMCTQTSRSYVILYISTFHVIVPSDSSNVARISRIIQI